jgi:hypothetical protein
MYEGATTAVRLGDGEGKEFGVKVLVLVHQGSVLSPLLFTIVLEALSRDFRGGLPFGLLYADDLDLMAESKEDLTEKFKVWKSKMEAKGLRVNMGKTKIMVIHAKLALSGQPSGLVGFVVKGLDKTLSFVLSVTSGSTKNVVE